MKIKSKQRAANCSEELSKMVAIWERRWLSESKSLNARKDCLTSNSNDMAGGGGGGEPV